MGKWYYQIALGVLALVVISLFANAIYPPDIFETTEDIMRKADTRAFYTVAIFGLLAQVLIFVGLVRGLIALIRKFRSFVRIKK